MTEMPDEEREGVGIDMLTHGMSTLAITNSDMQNDLRDTSPLHQPAVARPSTVLSGLDTITVKELSSEPYLMEDTGPQFCLEKQYRDKVVYAQFRREFMQTNDDVVILLVDANRDAICVHVRKLVWFTACTGEKELHYCVGKRVAIAKPLIEMDSDGLYVLRVVDPANVVCLDSVNTDGSSPIESSHATLLEALAEMRLEEASDATPLEALVEMRLAGNHFFAKQNWAAALNRYSQCIDQAVGKLENNKLPGTSSRENLNNMLMLAYTNRAEARLRLQHYQHALSDADEALKIEPKYLKTLVRKGKAAHGLGLYEDSCKIFEAALEESPGMQSVIECLTTSKTFLEQSRSGNYNTRDYALRGDGRQAPSCPDFLGPVEIRQVTYLKGGRGLFATTNVKAGEFLLVSTALARAPLYERGFENLIVELGKRVKTSKRQMAQLDCLLRYGEHDKEIPSMALFMPGSKWIPPGAEKFEFDAGDINSILRLNGFRKTGETPRENYSGIWALPSFANHSCAPNVSSILVGDTFFFRSAVDIMKGEELTITYLGDYRLLNDVKSRQELTNEGWLFTCKCVRCLLEESLRFKLSEFSRPSPSLVFDFTDDVLAARTKFRDERSLELAAKDLAKVADEVEDAIQSLDPKLGPREKSWIRATFLPAFHSKILLAIEQGDSESTISAFKLVLDSLTHVWINCLVGKDNAVLLEDVERDYSKDSQLYRLNLDGVLDYYGKSIEKCQ